MALIESAVSVLFPDTSHPMNKGSDGLVDPNAFSRILLGELRRQALNEVREQQGKIALPPETIYATHFQPDPNVRPKIEHWCSMNGMTTEFCMYCR